MRKVDCRDGNLVGISTYLKRKGFNYKPIRDELKANNIHVIKEDKILDMLGVY